MPGRGPQTFKKRQKEQQRKEKQEEKMAKRLARKNEPPGSGMEEDAEHAIDSESGETAVPGTEGEQSSAAGGFAA